MLKKGKLLKKKKKIKTLVVKSVTIFITVWLLLLLPWKREPQNQSIYRDPVEFRYYLQDKLTSFYYW